MTATEIGLIGLFVQTILVLYTLYRGIAASVRAIDPSDRGLAIGATVAFFCLFLVMQFEPGFRDITLWLMIGLIEGMAFRLVSKPDGWQES